MKSYKILIYQLDVMQEEILSIYSKITEAQLYNKNHLNLLGLCVHLSHIFHTICIYIARTFQLRNVRSNCREFPKTN